MRPSKQRSRSKSNRPKSLGNIVNRVFDSSGPEGKVRGTPQQIIDKYLVLARDAQLSNDRVAAENFLQHAEHYTRMLSEAQREMARDQEARREQGQSQQNQPQHGQNRRTDNRDSADRQGRDDQDSGQDSREGTGDDRHGQNHPRGDQRAEDRGDHGRGRGGREHAPLSSVDEGDETDSMLVETPESRAGHEPGNATEPKDQPDQPRSRSRGSRQAAHGADTAGQAGDAQGVQSDGSDAAKPTRQPRARRTSRKPKSDDPGPGSDGESAAAAE
ncbi:DUF4167 domain-containing protein [Pararhodobacter sp. SW119]|uniref:DUF4167 domain-containing protein n=1 Tax=Pararhodobacter sp. SW119 TaxID=2780075 RepID=UPI001ADFF797|nr:DUF4167 domain-containing protein [Pararhodobacter sp. SW119]